VLAQHLDRYEELERSIRKAEEKIEEAVEASPDPFVGEAIELLDTIPGVGRRIAEIIVAEIGANMEQFPTGRHLASWAGMCPGNNESGGKRLSGKTTKGSKYLRAALVQAAWAATRKKDCFLALQFQRLARRKGRNKAAVAVGHSILVIVYYVMKRKESYKELGGNYIDHKQVEGQKKRLIRQLESPGLRVKVEEAGEAA
jgi:transposase